MSRTGGAYARGFTYQALDRRAVVEIQRNIIKQGQRNGISRILYAKNDKETIASWRLDLNRILHVFNVRDITPARPSLTVHVQTELAINTNVVVSDVHRDVLNTQIIVSDIHRTIVGSQEGTDGTNRSVSDILLLYSLLNQHSPPPRLKPGSRSQLPTNPVSHICI